MLLLTHVPAIRTQSGHWINDSRSKAELFRTTWQAKMTLPPELPDAFFFAAAASTHGNFLLFRTRSCLRIFKKLNEQSATGPDDLSNRILKFVGPFIAEPFCAILSLFIRDGYWPDTWRVHRLVPLFKAKTYFDPANYRGLHITANLSKYAERLIAIGLGRFLVQHGFGENQWAFRPGRSARDLLCLLVNTWILCICRGNKIAFYKSDISGAFDRIFTPFLLAKLRSLGIFGPSCCSCGCWRISIRRICYRKQCLSRHRAWAHVVERLFHGCRIRSSLPVWSRNSFR